MDSQTKLEAVAGFGLYAFEEAPPEKIDREKRVEMIVTRFRGKWLARMVYGGRLYTAAGESDRAAEVELFRRVLRDLPPYCLEGGR